MNAEEIRRFSDELLLLTLQDLKNSEIVDELVRARGVLEDLNRIVRISDSKYGEVRK